MSDIHKDRFLANIGDSARRREKARHDAMVEGAAKIIGSIIWALMLLLAWWLGE